MNATDLAHTDALSSRQHYDDVIEHFSNNALAAFLEIVSEGEVTAATAHGIVDENTFEEMVGFGSPLDVGLRNGAEDRVALAVLSYSENRHIVTTDERVKRLSSHDSRGPASLFVTDDCIDYRFLAAVALHADIMAAFKAKLDARISGEVRTAVPS